MKEIDFEFGADLCRFLGLDPDFTTKVTVSAGVDEVPVIHVEGYVTKPDGERARSAGRWRLVHPQPSPQETDT